MRETRDEYQEEATADTNKKTKGKNCFYLKIIALALCCSFLGGVIGSAATLLTSDFLVEKNITDIIEQNKDFTVESHIRLRTPFTLHMRIAKSFIENEFLTEPYIGISVTNSVEPRGVKIDGVEKGSPADKAHLYAGDIITMVDNSRIYIADDLKDYIKKAGIGDEIKLTVYRNGYTIDCTVTVGEHSRFEK